MSLTRQRPLAVCVHAASFCKINAFAEDDCRYGNMEKAGGRPNKCMTSLKPCIFYEPTQTYMALPSNASKHIRPPKGSANKMERYPHICTYV